MQKDYHSEWMTLHNSYDRYETHSLSIKLCSIALFFVSFYLTIPYIITLITLLTLWLQDAIWKTFQSRTEQRLLLIEAELTQNDSNNSFQFYSEWEAKRPNTLGLIQDYIKNSLRPTVAFPYVVLVSIILWQLML